MILIRPYVARDLVQLSQTIDQVCSDTPWMSTRNYLPTTAWLHAMKVDSCQYHKLFIAGSNGEVVGWCRLLPASCGVQLPNIELGIGLLAQYRNQGIGTELIMRSLEWAEGVGLLKVDLTVSCQNSIAIHVFDKCGFETDQTYDNKMLMAVRLS